MTRILAVLVLAAVCVGFTPAPASAQLFRRSAPPCPNCPNGVCQPQASGPMFLAVPASPPKALPASAAPTLCYADAFEKAKPSEARFILAVGVTPLDPINFYGSPVFACPDAPAGTTPGHYQCAGGQWWIPGWRAFAPMPRPVVVSIKKSAAAPCPCTATSCTQGAPCPCTAGNCTCNAAAYRLPSASACSAAPSAGRSYVFPRVRAFFASARGIIRR